MPLVLCAGVVVPTLGIGSPHFGDWCSPVSGIGAPQFRGSGIGVDDNVDDDDDDDAVDDDVDDDGDDDDDGGDDNADDEDEKMLTMAVVMIMMR